MNEVRRVSFLATGGLLGIAVLLGSVSARPSISPHAATTLRRSASYFDSTIVLARNAQPRGIRGDELAIALGYLERLRLGLGSPFRLADEAQRDPRLGPIMSSRVAWALLERLRRGDAFVVEHTVLDGSGPRSADGHEATGAAHLALIDRAIRSASEPRAGELTVRLAYLTASTKGTVTASRLATAVRVAALIRDRESAVADLRDLLADANETHGDVMAMLAARRAGRLFRVEQPSLAMLSSKLRVEAMNAVAGLVEALDTLDRVTVVPAATGALATVLSPPFAERLRVLSADRPPVAQIAVTLRTQSPSRMSSVNDEMLVADYAGLVADSDSTRRNDARALLASAVALRSLAQQAPWFPGDGGPSIIDLTTEFGLSEVTFSRTVPAAWRPYYLRELRGGLRDMQRVLPALSFEQLRVRFGAEALPDSALAMHEPRTRTLQLSISTSGGTLAHELAHDLDWQEARRLFAHAGGYSTDRVMREQRGTLARSVRGLSEARAHGNLVSAGSAPPADRPAEVFARGADWFIASSLAVQGRMNGFLTAIEDNMLAGYAAGAPAAAGLAGAMSLTSALDEMTYLPDSVRVPFESQWSDAQVVDPVLLVRRVIEAPILWRAVWQQRTGAGSLLPSASVTDCAMQGADEADARARLLMFAVDARARGVVSRRARFRPAGGRADWANSALATPPWSAEDGEQLISDVRAAIFAQLSSALPNQGVVPTVPAVFAVAAAIVCRDAGL